MAHRSGKPKEDYTMAEQLHSKTFPRDPTTKILTDFDLGDINRRIKLGSNGGRLESLGRLVKKRNNKGDEEDNLPRTSYG
jgi:hypothetical protein